jgi:hypothetical protein
MPAADTNHFAIISALRYFSFLFRARITFAARRRDAAEGRENTLMARLRVPFAGARQEEAKE